MQVSFFNGPSSHSESRRTVLIAQKSMCERVFHLLDELGRSIRKPRIETVHGGERDVTPCSWEQLTLSAETQAMLRDDFEAFFQREKWYRSHGIPFRRGYLLHGPPGN